MTSTHARPWALITLLAALQAFGPLSIDMYLPAISAIAADFATTTDHAQQTISAFLFGLFAGMLLYGPLSDHYGRRRLLLGGITLYLVATVACLFSADATQLSIARLFQAFGGAAASVLGRTLVRDLFPSEEAPQILSLMHLVTMLATLAAPLVGSLLLQFWGWRMIFVLLVLFAAIMLLAVSLRIPDTGRNPKSSPLRVYVSYLQLAREPLAMGYVLCIGLTFTGLFAYITGSPFVFMDYFGKSPTVYALYFGANIVGVIVVVLLNARFVKRVGVRRMLLAGGSTAALAGVLLLGGAWLAPDALWIIVLGTFLLISITGLIGANCIARLMQLYPNNAGAASGLAIAMQFGLGALGSALLTQIHDGTTRPLMVCVGLAGIAALLSLRLSLTRDKAPRSHPLR